MSLNLLVLTTHTLPIIACHNDLKLVYIEIMDLLRMFFLVPTSKVLTLLWELFNGINGECLVDKIDLLHCGMYRIIVMYLGMPH